VSSPGPQGTIGESPTEPTRGNATGADPRAPVDLRLVLVLILTIGALLCLVWSFWWLKSPNDALEDSAHHLRLYLWIVLLTSLLLLVGVAHLKLRHYVEQERAKPSEGGRHVQSFWHAIGHELGIALFVAAVVSMLFEYTVRVAESEQRQREQKVLKENVYQAIFGHTVDANVIKEVVESVFESPLTRQNFEINCHLYRADQAREFVRARVEMRYHLKNTLLKTVVLASDSDVLKPDEVRERQVGALIESQEPGAPNTDCFTSFVVSDEVLKPRFVLSESNLKEARAEAIDDFAKRQQQRQTRAAVTAIGLSPGAITDDAGATGMIIRDWPKVCGGFEYHYGARHQRVVIKRLEIRPGEAVVVDYTYEQTRRQSDSLDIFTPHPTTNSQFTVSKGEGAGDLHVAVESTHRHQPVRLTQNVQHEGPGQTYEYQMTGALLPGQLVEVSWYPQSTEVAKRDGNTGKAAGR